MLDKLAQPHLTIPTLEAYLDNTLPLEKATAVHTHLQNCAHCRHWLAQEANLTQRLVYAPRPQHRLPAAKAAEIQKNVYRKLRRESVMKNIRVSLRAVTALIILAMVIGGFFWWQTIQHTAQQVEPTAVATPIPSNDAQTTITFAARNFEQQSYLARIEQFEELHPEIKVQFVPFEDAVGNGRISPGQIASLADTAVVAQNTLASGSSAFLSLEPLRAADATFNNTDFWPGMLSACQPDAQLRGLPLQATYTLIFYDADLFAQAGIEPPAPNWRWEQFLAAAQAIADSDTGRYGFVAANGPAELFAPFVAARAAVAPEKLAAELTPLVANYAELITEGVLFADADFETANQLIDNGQAAMWTDTQINFAYRQSSLGNQIQMAPFPQINDVSGSPAEADCLTISAGTTQPDAAWTWLTFLIDNPPPDLAQGTRLPARRTVAEADTYWQSRMGAETVFGYVAEHATFGTATSAQSSILAALSQAIQDGADLTAVLPAAVADAPEPTAVSTTAPIVVATPAPDPAASGTAVIHYLTSGFSHAPFATIQTIADEFNAAHPKIQVEVGWDVLPGSDGFFGIEQISEQYDCFADTALHPEEAAFVYSLSSLLDSDTTGLVKDIYPGLFEPFTLEGEIYALPNSVSPAIIYYNADLLAAQGLEPPALDWSLDDLLTMAQQARNPEAGVTHGFVPFQVGDPIEWLLAEQGIALYDAGVNPPQVAFDNPDLPGILNQLVRLNEEGVMYAVLNLGSQEWEDNYSTRERLVVNSHAPFWTDAAGLNGGFYEGELPAFVQPATLPVINGRISPPLISGFYISRRLADPQPCWEWINFLSGNPASPGSVPARISVAESAAWETAVGPQTAAVFRTSMERQIAQSKLEGPSAIGTYPLDRWWGDVVNAAYRGEPIEPLLAAAQQKGQLYVACMSELTAPTRDQTDACAKEADPDYKTFQELQ